MALLPYQVTLIAKQDAPYNVLPDTDLSIRKVSDDTLVQIYADEAGLTPIAQPGAKTDSRGVFEFYTDSAPVIKAVWSDGVVNYSETFNGNSLQSLSGLTEPSNLAQRHRISTSVAEVQSGVFSVGDKLSLSDRYNAMFDVVSGGVADTFGIIDAGNGNTAKLVQLITGYGSISAGEVGKTTDDSLRFYLANVNRSTWNRYGSFWYINGTESTSTFINQANFAGQTLGAAAPVGWVDHHYTDGIMHQWDNVGGGTSLFIKNAQNPGRRPDKPANYVGTGKFIAFGTEGHAPSSERMYLTGITPGILQWVSYDDEQSWESDKDDGTGYAFTYKCYKPVELVARWQAAGVTQVYFRRNPVGNAGEIRFPQAGKNGVFSDGAALYLGATDSVVIQTGATSKVIAAAGDLRLETATGGSNGVLINAPLKLTPLPTASLPTLGANERAIMWDSTLNTLVKWDGASWSAV